MTGSVFLKSIGDRLDASISRAQAVTKGMSEEQLNWQPDPKSWSTAQLLEHMLLAANPYLHRMNESLAVAKKGEGDPEISFSWFGRAIMKGAGPSGNAPVPKPMVPSPGPYKKEIIERWINAHRQAKAFASKADRVDISSIAVRNPLIPLFKMNVADCFEIIAAHSERHVGQMENLKEKIPQLVGR